MTPDGTMPADPEAAGRLSVVPLTRLAVALIQAAGLYLLVESSTKPLAWPATEPTLFTPLLAIFVFIPLLIMVGLGQISRRPLTFWAMAAAIVVAALGYHAEARLSTGVVPENVNPHAVLYWLESSLWLQMAAGLFIAHTLVVDGVMERRWRPSYSRHFDTAWKQGVQAALTVVFVGVFWGVLTLGAALFDLLKIPYFRQLIRHDWFAIPATTLAIAGAVHITDVQPALIRGARALALTLLSWLLPLLVVIVAGFLGSLPFLSLQPLWHTHVAASLLLTAAALLILLINCCYQDGAAERTTVAVKRWAGTVGAVALLPLVALAGWALGLRVDQYGWSVQRVEAAAVTLVLAAYTAGYAVAVIRAPNPGGPHWLRRLEPTNHITAHVVLLLLLALLTPVADPARLMVADQMARLRAGTLPPEKLDLVALRFEGARWGRDAVTALGQATDARWTADQTRTLHANVATVLSKPNRYQALDALRRQPDTTDPLENVTVYPAGRTLPPAFLQAYATSLHPNQDGDCGRKGGGSCNAFLIALPPGGPEAVIIQDGYRASRLYQQDDSGAWHQTGTLERLPNCAAVRDALKQGLVTPVPHPLPDLMVAGVRLDIQAPDQGCPTSR